jgi:hypothetical protein
MAKKKDSRLKLPDDFLGTVAALLNTKPPKKKGTRKKAVTTQTGQDVDDENPPLTRAEIRAMKPLSEVNPALASALRRKKAKRKASKGRKKKG